MVGPIQDVKAVGQLVLVEQLTNEEAMNTRLIVGEDAKVPPQAYILDIGPLVKASEWGFKVGDRVLLQGTYVPVPRFERANQRKLGMVQPQDIKAVIIEGQALSE